MAAHPQAPVESDPTSPLPAPGWQGIASDWASDKDAFKQVPWGKAMMWIFLLSDTFIFTCFLTGYMSVRMTITDARLSRRSDSCRSAHNLRAIPSSPQC